MEERRQDYISLPKLLEANTINSNDISHMKKTLDKIEDKFSKFLDIYAEDQKKLGKLQLQMKWVIAGILAFFGSLGTMTLLFGKKIAAVLATIL